MQTNTQVKSKKSLPGIFQPFVTYFKTNYGVLIGFVALCLILTFTTDSFFKMSNIINVLRQVSINGIIAVGITCVILIGGIDLSVGSIVGASGTLAVMLIMKGVPLPLALLAGVLSGALFGFINGYVIAKTGMPYFIVTLATQTVVRGIGYIFTDGYPITSDSKVFNDLGNGYVGPIPVPVIIMVVILIIFAILLSKTRFGRHMYAVGGNREAARFSGVDVKKVQMIVFTLSGVLSAIAGIILAARLNSGQPTVGVGFEGDAIAASVLGGVSFAGGVGTIGGTLIGILIIGVLNNGMNLLKISFYYQLVSKGLVILGAVYFDTVKKNVFDNRSTVVKEISEKGKSGKDKKAV